MREVFLEVAGRHSDVLALSDPHRKPATSWTFGELAAQVRSFGAGLLQSGVTHGERVALFADNRPRWLVADLALLSIGAVECPRGSDTATPEFEFILQHSGATAAILQDRRLFERLASSPALAGLRLVVLMDDSAGELSAPEGVRVTNFADLLAAGETVLELFDEASVRPDDLAAIVYTSGTTGCPKGVMLTHANLAFQADRIDIGCPLDPGDTVLSILPVWHVYERAIEYFCMARAVTLYYTDKRHLKEDLASRVRPHLFPCVPRIWETIYDAIQDRVGKAPPARQRLFHFFSSVGHHYVKARRTATGLALSRKPAGAVERVVASLMMATLAPLHALGDKLVFSKLRAAITGGRIKAAVSGGGSLAAYLDDFFEVAGIPILNGYGLTETSPVLCVRRLDHNVRGSVGRPIVATEITIRSETGEDLPQGSTGVIHARGPQVMSGYYRNEEATARVLDGDGWFNTGDLGYVSATGDVVITGRAKDTIVLASGENVEPEPIEDVARQSPLVSQIMLVGQDQKVLGALVVPNGPALAAALGLPEDTDLKTLCADQRAAKVVRDSIAHVMRSNGGFKEFEAVTRVALLDEPFSEENGLLTQTMKIRRNVVSERYTDTIRALFA